MARREKLIQKMRSSPGNIRVGEVDALLKYEGFVLFKLLIREEAIAPTIAPMGVS